MATRVLASNKVMPTKQIKKYNVVFSCQIPHFQNYFSGDPYVGPRTQELEKKKNRIVELEKENKELRNKIKELESRYIAPTIVCIPKNK